jgi:tetratricopeptide (TPR) repeat protein
MADKVRWQLRLARWVPPFRCSAGPARGLRRTLLLFAFFGCAIPGGISAQSLSPEAKMPTASQKEIAAGIRLMQARDFRGAVARFSAALRTDPASADALVWRGICENQLGRFAEAERDLTGALKQQPNSLPAHYNLALTLLHLNRPDAARRQFERVIEGDPSAQAARYNLAILLEKQRDLAGAAEQLGYAWKLNGSDTSAGEHLLIDDLALGRAADAAAVGEQLLAVETDPKAQQGTGAALAAAGYAKEALPFLESSRQHGLTSRESTLLLARTYIAAEQSFTAISLLKSDEQTDTTGETAYLLGLAYGSAGATQEAKDAFDACHALQPRDARCLFQLALLRSKGDKADQAEATHQLRAAIRLEPGNPTYSIALARLLLQTDDPSGALAVLTPLHVPQPLEAQRLLLLGIAQTATKGAASAEATLRRSIQLDPSIALSHNILGFCLFSQGHYEEAAASYRLASDLQPAVGNFAYSTAVAYERAGSIPNAIPYAQRAASLPDATAESHLLLGKLYLGVKRTGEGVRELETAIHINPDLESPYYLLARTYMQQGDSAKAQAMNDQLAALKSAHDPSHAAASGTAPAASGVSGASALLEGKTAGATEASERVP